jgi:phasin family protein
MSNKTSTDAVATEGVARASVVAEQAQANLKDGIEGTMNTAAKITAYGQRNLEALTKCTQIWTAGVQDLTKQAATSFQGSVEEAVGVVKKLGTVKSLKEAIDLQSGFVRTTLERLVSESGRFAEASVRLTEQALAPVAERLSLIGEPTRTTL